MYKRLHPSLGGASSFLRAQTSWSHNGAVTTEEGVGTSTRPIRPLLVIGALTLCGAFLYGFFLAGEGRLIVDPRLPWPLLALAFFLFESRTVDVHFRGEAHSFSMSDIPMIVGVFYLPPHLLLLAQFLGTLPAFALSRRLPVIKTAFNSALYLFTAASVATIIRAVPSVAEVGPSSWVATVAILQVLSLVSAGLIALMIASSSGAWPRNWSTGLAISTLVVLTNSCVGLLAVRIIRGDALAMLLLIPPIFVLWLAYKAYAAQQQRQTALAKLNRASQETASRLSLDELSPVVLGHACDLFATGYAELVLVSGTSVKRWTMEDGIFSKSAGAADPEPSLLDALAAERGLFSNAPAGKSPFSRYLAAHKLAEASAAPLSEPHSGFLLAGNRSSGARARWEQEDIQLLGNLADHVSVLLTNAGLIEKLQESLDAAETANRELVRTISDKEAAEEQRRALEGRLRQSHKMEAVGRLAGGIAHDFNNLLTIISGYANLLLQRPAANGSPPRGVEEIVDATERGSRLVKQLLLFSRNDEAPSPEVLALNEVVKDLESLLFMSGGGRVQLEFDLDPSSPQVLMDRGRLDQVLLNLAANARDAMPSGGTLKISTEKREAPDGLACLRVSDTGEGMPPEVLERAFEPFFTTKGDGGGTGLGLATVYGIIEQAGGKIDVDSAPGAGTTFEILLPSPMADLEGSTADS